MPLSFAEAAAYPYAVMERMPARIAEKEKEIARLREEIPVLEEIIGRKWPKATELETLKAQCRELQHKIEEEFMIQGTENTNSIIKKMAANLNESFIFPTTN